MAKTVSWRAVALLITAAIAWAVTGDARVALTLGLTDTAIKLVSYYAHERAWNRLDFGRVADPEYHI